MEKRGAPAYDVGIDWTRESRVCTDTDAEINMPCAAKDEDGLGKTCHEISGLLAHWHSCPLHFLD